MKKKLNNNVELEVIKNEKFNTIRIEVDFLREIAERESSIRKLLSNVLSHSSEKYPKMIDLSRKTMDLYGADLNSTNRHFGNINDLNFSIEIIDEGLLEINSKKLIVESIDLLNEIIFNPLLSSDKTSFDIKNFEVEKDNLISGLKSIQDNKEMVSYFKLWEMLFENQKEFTVSSFGNLNEVESITNEELFDYYKKVIAEDAIKITIVGDVDEKNIINSLDQTDFSLVNSENRKKAYWKKQTLDLNGIKEKTESDTLNQSRVSLGFEIKNTNFSTKIPLQIFNLILGGDDQSLLFQNVREKNSLAYSVNSQFYPFSNVLTVQAGVSKDTVSKTIEVVKEQIDNLKDGKITVEQIQHAQKVLISRRKIGNDRITSLVSKSIWNYLKEKSTLSDEEFYELVKEIKLKDIEEIAKNVKLVAVYKLIGEEDG